LKTFRGTGAVPIASLVRSVTSSHEAIAGAQRSGLLGSGDGLECLGRDAGRVRGPAVISCENLFVGGESGLAQSERFGFNSGREEKARMMAADAIRVRMLGGRDGGD